jgi:hypothetical protein
MPLGRGHHDASVWGMRRASHRGGTVVPPIANQCSSPVSIESLFLKQTIFGSFFRRLSPLPYRVTGHRRHPQPNQSQRGLPERTYAGEASRPRAGTAHRHHRHHPHAGSGSPAASAPGSCRAPHAPTRCRDTAGSNQSPRLGAPRFSAPPCMRAQHHILFPLYDVLVIRCTLSLQCTRRDGEPAGSPKANGRRFQGRSAVGQGIIEGPIGEKSLPEHPLHGASHSVAVHAGSMVPEGPP